MKRILDRRAAIVRTIGLCWLMAVFWAPSQVAAQNAVLRLIEAANPRVVLADGDAADPAALGIQLEGAWERGQWTGRVVHAGNRPVRLREIVLADIQHGLPGETPVYGEGFTMLAQTGGTLAAPVDEGFYPDRSHYKIPEPEGLRTVYGVMTLQNSATEHTVLAFGGCRKYVGRLSFDATRLRVSLDIESLEMKPGETWELEPFIVRSGPDRPKLLQQIADRGGLIGIGYWADVICYDTPAGVARAIAYRLRE